MKTKPDFGKGPANVCYYVLNQLKLPFADPHSTAQQLPLPHEEPDTHPLRGAYR
jgi:hypothetical protein